MAICAEKYQVAIYQPTIVNRKIAKYINHRNEYNNNRICSNASGIPDNV
jgi:hypothetical protein